MPKYAAAVPGSAALALPKHGRPGKVRFAAGATGPVLHERIFHKESHVFEILYAAGWVSWFFTLPCSIIALVIIIERSLSLRRSLVCSPDLVGLVVQEYQRGAISPERLQQLSEHSPLGRVLAVGLQYIKSPPEVTKEALEEAGTRAAHELDRFLTTLGTIATIAPLFGLLGTVIGMIHMFGAQAPGSGNPQLLAQGIAEALYNTAFGLFVAIPAMIFYRHFRAKVDSLLVDMQQQAVRMVEMLHGERTI